MRRRRDWRVLGILAVIVFTVLAGLTFSERGVGWNYLVGVLLTIEIYALFAFGISLEFGYTGLLNFGHVATMGIGAYTVGILGERLLDTDAPYSRHLEGLSVGGFAACLFLAALLAAMALVPLLLGVPRLVRGRLPARFQVPLCLGGAAVVGLFLFASMFPLSGQGAEHALVFLTVVLGIVLAALAGLVLGLPAVRLREDYLAIVTLGGAEILRSIEVNDPWLITHGTLGIQRLHRPIVEWALGAEWWRDFARSFQIQPTALALTLVGLVLVAFVYLVFEVLVRSPWGRVLRAIRDDEAVALSLGKNVQLYKLESLMLGSAVGAAAGVLLVWNFGNVYPEHFLPLVTFYGFIIVIIGGVGNHRGVLAGALLLWGLFELAGNLTFLAQFGIRDIAGPPQGIFIGLVLVLIMMFRPQGVLGRREEMLFGR